MSDATTEALAAALARQRDALAVLDLAGVERAASDELALLPALDAAAASPEERLRLAELAALNRALAAQALELADAFLRVPVPSSFYARTGRLRSAVPVPRFEAVG